MKPLSGQIMQLLKGDRPETSADFWTEAYSVLRANALTPWIYAHHRPSAPIGREYEADYKFSALMNKLHLEEARQVELHHRLVRVKGSALISTLYPDSATRVFCDVDYLASPVDAPAVAATLKKMGYAEYTPPLWRMGRNRTTYVKQEAGGIELSFDLHTSLFWQAPTDFPWETTEIGGMLTLSPEDHFFYLAVNWSYQDTFVGLYKAVDLALMWKKYSAEWNEARIQFLTEHFKLQRPMKMVLSILERWLACDTRAFSMRLGRQVRWLTEAPTPDFLLAPQAMRARYLLMKHFTKSSLTQALEYDLLWLRAHADR